MSTSPSYRSTLQAPLAAAALALVASGCVSKLTGNEGNLVFSYIADDNAFDFNKAIAIGARLDIAVAENGSEKAAQLQAATSADPKVLSVVSTAASSATVEGVGDGNTLLEVEATVSGGETVSDSVNLRVRKPEVLQLHHVCTTDSKAHYLTGNLVGIAYELQLKNGENVIGYGLHPVKITPATGAALDTKTKAQQFLWLTIGSTPGTVELASTIDSRKLTLEVVAPAAIDGALLDGDAVVTTALVGTKKLVHVRPTAGGSPVCGANTEFSAQSTAPEVCKVKALTVANVTEGTIDAWGWIEVEALKIGTCTFEVLYPKGKAGAGLKAGLELTVKQLVGP